MAPDLTIQLGSFAAIECFGEGSFCEVCRMGDAILNRPAALKVPYRELLNDQSFVAQFRQDACLAAQLDHPNIVRIHAIDQSTRFPLVS